MFLCHKKFTCEKCGAVCTYPMGWATRIPLWGFTIVLGMVGSIIFFVACIVACVFDLYLLFKSSTPSPDDQVVLDPPTSPASNMPMDDSGLQPLVSESVSEEFGWGQAIIAGILPFLVPEACRWYHMIVGIVLPFFGIPWGVMHIKRGNCDIGRMLIVWSSWGAFVWTIFLIFRHLVNK
jgi:hypothetical protein